jgi:hypothetical protein
LDVRDDSAAGEDAAMSSVRRFVVFLSLMFSFGGFTFYAAVVVPIGGRVFGITEQGFVTRQVTVVLNAATAVTIAMLLWETIAGRKMRARSATATLLMLTTGMAAAGLLLVQLHPRLESHLNVEALTVTDGEQFYRWHQYYLWASAAQCLLTLPVIWKLLDAPAVDAPAGKTPN